MTKTLKYTWPAFVCIFLLTYNALESFGIAPELPFTEFFTLFFTFAGIYYLYTSPFGQTQFLALATLLLIRFLIPILVPFGVMTGISFYIGSNVFILFYYSLRTLQKEPIQKPDYSKLFLVGGFILLQVAYYGGLIYVNHTPDEELSYSYGSYITFLEYVNIFSRFIAYGLVLVHLWHIGKWEKDQLDQREMELIEKIGEEEGEKKFE